MLSELALATVMVSVTVALHGLGLSLIGVFLRTATAEELTEHVPVLSLRGLSVTYIGVLGLFALHGLEIWLYAYLFRAIGAIGSVREAVYFSTITYGAIGYEDSAMAEPWRLVSAIEGINGILLIGWTTAFFVTRIARMRQI